MVSFPVDDLIVVLYLLHEFHAEYSYTFSSWR